jgi:hypothetical protein
MQLCQACVVFHRTAHQMVVPRSRPLTMTRSSSSSGVVKIQSAGTAPAQPRQQHDPPSTRGPWDHCTGSLAAPQRLERRLDKRRRACTTLTDVPSGKKLAEVVQVVPDRLVGHAQPGRHGCSGTMSAHHITGLSKHFSASVQQLHLMPCLHSAPGVTTAGSGCGRVDMGNRCLVQCSSP